jgi:hypothetical protein
LTSYITFGPSQFLRAINIALEGKISPDLIPYNHLKQLLSSYPDFDDTLYQSQNPLTTKEY